MLDNIDTMTGGLNTAPPALEPHTNTDGINDEGRPAFDEAWHSDSSDTHVPAEHWADNFSAPAAEALVDADTGELEKLLPIDITDAQEPRVNLRDVHARLESKQKFTDWVKNRVEQCDLVKDQDYGVFHKSMKNPSGGRPSVEYWVTLDAAKEIALVEGTAKGKEIRRYFIECEKRLRNMPTAPVIDFSDPLTTVKLYIEAEEGRRQALQSLGLSRQLLGDTSHKLRQAEEDLTVKEEELGVAVTEKQEEERKAAAMARAVSIEAESKILTGWLKEVSSVTGVGPRTATKILQAHGILCRNKVEGCSNTDEPGISKKYVDLEWLCYSFQDRNMPCHKFQDPVGKTIAEDRLDADGNVITGKYRIPGPFVVPVLDENGDHTFVHSRTVKITPKGCPLIMNLLTTCNETLLCRLINLVKIKELQILKGRYTFAEKHNFAHKLFPKSLDTARKMIRIIEPKDSVSGLWEVWTFLAAAGFDKVFGSGATLEQAYMRLAAHMKAMGPYVGCDEA